MTDLRRQSEKSFRNGMNRPQNFINRILIRYTLQAGIYMNISEMSRWFPSLLVERRRKANKVKMLLQSSIELPV